MNVCLDIQSAIAQRAGVGRYTRMLAQHLGAFAKDSEVGLFFFDFMRRGHPFQAPRTHSKAVRWMPGRIAQAAWKSLHWPPFDWLAGPSDIYHFPNFILPPLRQGKSVVTIHDMSFMRFPEFAESRNLSYLTARILDTAARADAVITDSRFSASEIHNLLDVPNEKIFPIHLGIDDGFYADAESAPPLPDTWGIDRPYLLTVGTLEPRKNIPFLIDVFESLTSFDGLLVLVGMQGWKCEPILERIRNSSRAADIRYLNFVDDALLPSLYAHAELFVITSVYEGFGFPPLEAMACGVPVVASNGGSLPEVLGEAADIVEVFERDNWCETIQRMLTNSDHRKHLIQKGRQWASRYTWSETARQTWDVYEHIL